LFGIGHKRDTAYSDADGIGEVGNPLCGDMMTIYLKIKDCLLQNADKKEKLRIEL